MNNSLRRSIQQILLAGSAATFAVGALAAVGQQNPPPGPGQIPDYFGVTPNYANSPQPILAQVFKDVTSSYWSRCCSNRNWMHGAITGFSITNGGSGYVKPAVNITDQPAGSGASVTVATAATQVLLSGITMSSV